MFDERLLARALARPAQETAGAALDEVMHLAQSAEYREAAERAGPLLEAGCHDARALVAYSLGLFAERGPASVPAIFAALAGLLSTLAAGNSPQPTARAADTALRFCFRTMKAHLDFEERQSMAARQTWARLVQDSDAPRTLDACSELQASIRAALATAHCETELANVAARLQAYFGRLTRAPVPEPNLVHVESAAARTVQPNLPELPCSSDGGNTPPVSAAVPPGDQRLAASPVFARRASDHDADLPLLELSPALYEFKRKLQIFELLVESGELAKAAIVAHDVRKIVTSFDPMVYLPNLLSPHFRLLSSHADQISTYWEQTSAPTWQALEQLYRVDLDSFVEA
ncbi:MAG TPA: type VI secretion system protein IglI family protein [Polyangiaceae bacterium]|nr:type VI secretion system protein IglI family protein [Polyangiaceae bacterium]